MGTPELIRIATRGSALALAQAGMVARAIEQACALREGGKNPCRAELVTFSTLGDRSAGPLAALGGKGVFTAELEAALRAGRVELAVHSAKDLPARMADDLVLAGVPLREDPCDALVTRHGGPLASLPAGAVVGTGSNRRSAQLLALRPDLRVVPIRGNVETRLKKVLPNAAEPLDAVVLALAGLKRSGLWEMHKDRIGALSVEEFIPAAGQAALALQSAAGNAAGRAAATSINDADSMDALVAERGVVAALEADCQSCLAVYVGRAGAGWRALGMAARADGSGAVRCSTSADSAAGAGAELLRQLTKLGAAELLRA
jgi:hydroxymethylbilane synthase